MSQKVESALVLLFALVIAIVVIVTLYIGGAFANQYLTIRIVVVVGSILFSGLALIAKKIFVAFLSSTTDEETYEITK